MVRRNCCEKKETTCNLCVDTISDVLVNLGIGGWANGYCICDNIAGEYVLTQYEGNNLTGKLTCHWRYEITNNCWPVYGDLGVFVEAFLGNIGEGIFWAVTVNYQNFGGGYDPPSASCTWKSKTIATGSDCSELKDSDGNVQLTKLYESVYRYCGGSMPETITLQTD
jgi:hypothetical protein